MIFLYFCPWFLALLFPSYYWILSYNFRCSLLSCTHVELSYRLHPFRHIYLPNLGIYSIGFAKSSNYIIWYPLYEQYFNLIEWKDSIVVKGFLWLIGLAPPSPMFRLASIAKFPWTLLTLLSIFTVKFSFGFKGYTRNWTALLFNPCRHFMCRPTHNYSFIAYLLTCGLNQFSGLLVDYRDWSLDLLLRSFRSESLSVYSPWLATFTILAAIEK